MYNFAIAYQKYTIVKLTQLHLLGNTVSLIIIRVGQTDIKSNIILQMPKKGFKIVVKTKLNFYVLLVGIQLKKRPTRDFL